MAASIATGATKNTRQRYPPPQEPRDVARIDATDMTHNHDNVKRPNPSSLLTVTKMPAIAIRTNIGFRNGLHKVAKYSIASGKVRMLLGSRKTAVYTSRAEVIRSPWDVCSISKVTYPATNPTDSNATQRFN